MKLQYIAAALLSATYVTALPVAADEDASLLLSRRAAAVTGNDIDLPSFITALFNGLANTVLAAGDSAANTIGATGGALANGNSNADPITAAVANSTSSSVADPAFITALFNGIANTILASGDSAANVIAATGGAIANANAPASSKTKSTKAKAKSSKVKKSEEMGKGIGEKAGADVGDEIKRWFVHDKQ